MAAKRAGRGLFVVLEGLDGSGTTTQSKRLVSWLEQKGVRAHVTAQPSSGPIGTQIRQILTGRLRGRGGPFERRALALLFAADRLDHLDAVIEPELARGGVVVSDRYLLSSLAYQGLDAKVEWVANINAMARPPDCTLFLQVRPEVALKRRLAATPGRAEIFETLPLQKRIAKNYEAALRTHGKEQKVRVLDGEASLDDVTAAVRTEVEALLKRR